MLVTYNVKHYYFREENVSPTNSKENVTPNKSLSGSEKDGDKKNGSTAAAADGLPETNLDLPVPYRKTGSYCNYLVN